MKADNEVMTFRQLLHCFTVQGLQEGDDFPTNTSNAYSSMTEKSCTRTDWSTPIVEAYEYDSKMLAEEKHVVKLV